MLSASRAEVGRCRGEVQDSRLSNVEASPPKIRGLCETKTKACRQKKKIGAVSSSWPAPSKLRVSGESWKENAKINFEGDASEEPRCLLKVCF